MEGLDPQAPSRGLGDTIAKLTRATGLDRMVERAAQAVGKDCGCAKRREALNRLVPYGHPAGAGGPDEAAPGPVVAPKGKAEILAAREAAAVPATAPPPGPRPREILLGLLADPEWRHRMVTHARGLDPHFPNGGHTLLVWATLQSAGYLTPYRPQVADQMHRLVTQGLRMFPAAMVTPTLGDLWVQVGPDKRPERTGWVLEADRERGLLLSFDADGEGAGLVREIPLGDLDYLVRIP